MTDEKGAASPTSPSASTSTNEKENGDDLRRQQQQNPPPLPPPPRPIIRGAVFDMDGTLTLPVIDFAEMRRRAGVPPGGDILATIEAITDPEAKAAAIAAVEEVEREGLEGLAPAKGLHSVLSRLDELGLPRGLVTRNNRFAVEVFHERLLVVEEEGEGDDDVAVKLKEVEVDIVSASATASAPAASSSGCKEHQQHHRHHHHHEQHPHAHRHQRKHRQRRRLPPFDPALSRDFKPPKPSPAAIHACAEAWGVDARELVMVGDSLADDVVAGNRAGAHTILLDERGGDHDDVRASFACSERTPTAVAKSLEHAVELLETIFELRPPKSKKAAEEETEEQEQREAES